jgi:Arc/MetJ family transcription regulator
MDRASASLRPIGRMRMTGWPQQRDRQGQAALRALKTPPEIDARAVQSTGLRVAAGFYQCHIVHMKRTNLVLDEKLLEQATRLSGEKTYSRAVQRALEEFVRRIQARQILDLAGTGLWEGSVEEMRRDPPSTRRKARR